MKNERVLKFHRIPNMPIVMYSCTVWSNGKTEMGRKGSRGMLVSPIVTAEIKLPVASLTKCSCRFYQSC